MKKSIIISIIMLLIISINISAFADLVPPQMPEVTTEASTETTPELPRQIISSPFFNNLRTNFMKTFSNVITIARNTIAKILEGFDIKVEEGEDGLKLKLGFNYDGNLIKIESANDGVVSFDFETMTLKATGDGETTLNIKIGEKVIPIKVAVKGGKLSLEPQEKGVTFNGAGTATFDVDEKNVSTIEAETSTTAGITENGLEAEMTAKQDVKILDKIKMNFNEGAEGTANLEGIEGKANASAGVAGFEVANGDVELGYKTGENDPTLSLNATVLSKKLAGVKDQVIPIFTTVKKLFANILGR